MDASPSSDGELIQPGKERAVFAKFLAKEILGEQGRLLFSLLNAFSMSGYQIHLFDSILRQDLGKYGGLVRSLPHLMLTDARPTDTAAMVYLYDKEDKGVAKQPWRKKVQVKFDVFSPYWFSDPTIMPFPVHPLHAGPDLKNRLLEYRQLERKMRIFFSGDTAGYVKSRIYFPKAKLPRLVVISTILEHMGSDLALIRDPGSLARLIASYTYANKCVLVEPNSFRIDPQNWLSTLARSDFFLCPPGYVMPMCHNAIEAMAVGAIPIINYPEWFNPKLRHLENCIVFDDTSDLVNQLNAVLAMADEQIDEMRQLVIGYYESHLTSGSFARKIESSRRTKLVVLMITEPNAARNASRLGRHSILIRGASTLSGGGPFALLRKLKE